MPQHPLDNTEAIDRKINTQIHAQNIDLGELLRAIINDPNTHIEGCDIQLYLSKLDALDAPEEDKKEFIHTLWSIIETIILTQFRIDPITVATRDNGRTPNVPPSDMVYSLHNNQNTLTSTHAAINGGTDKQKHRRGV